MSAATAAPAVTANRSIPRPAMTRAGKTAVGLLVLLGIGALAGGAALVSAPDGSAMQFDVSLLSGSPFSDYFFPGLILGGLFGLGSFTVAILGVRGVYLAPFLAFAIGCGQMIWIIVELVVIKELSFLHPTFFGVGLAVALASVRWGWPTFQGWLAARS